MKTIVIRYIPQSDAVFVLNKDDFPGIDYFPEPGDEDYDRFWGYSGYDEI